MKAIEDIKAIHNKSSRTDDSTINKNKSFFIVDGNRINVKENTAKTGEVEKFNIPREESIQKLNEIKKRKILNLLRNENIEVGYTSMTEMYINEILEQDPSQTKDILNLVYSAIFDKPELLQSFIEVMSNLDYKKLHPLNTILALGVINHKDIGVQEAAIAAYEKWDDKANLVYLNNINYTADWIKNYALKVIEYLEGC